MNNKPCNAIYILDISRDSPIVSMFYITIHENLYRSLDIDGQTSSYGVSETLVNVYQRLSTFIIAREATSEVDVY